MATSTVRNRSRSVVPAVIIAVLAIAGGALFWYLEREPEPSQTASLTAEAKEYVRNLGLSDVEMSRTGNYVGQDIIEITGKITNNGDRQLQQVEINCVFYDAYSQLVLRERVAIVRARDGGLAPGGTKNFRLAFDNIPASWNQNMPQLVIANIQF